MRRQYQAAADAGDVNLDDLLIMHAFGAPPSPRTYTCTVPAAFHSSPRFTHRAPLRATLTARASDAVRRRVVSGFCAEECCPPDHPLLTLVLDPTLTLTLTLTSTLDPSPSPDPNPNPNQECCPPDHPLVVCAQHTATFCQVTLTPNPDPQP